MLDLGATTPLRRYHLNFRAIDPRRAGTTRVDVIRVERAYIASLSPSFGWADTLQNVPPPPPYKLNASAGSKLAEFGRPH